MNINKEKSLNFNILEEGNPVCVCVAVLFVHIMIIVIPARQFIKCKERAGRI